MPLFSLTHSKTRLIGTLLVFFITGEIGIRLYDAWQRHHQQTTENTLTTVTVIQAKTGPETETIILPGNVLAWHEVPIYARVNGYLKSWRTDIGTRVKAEALLAEIDTPELDAELRQAEADLKVAQANYRLAQTTAIRWEKLRQTDSVSLQETEEKISDAEAKKAAVESAQANRDRLKDLEAFKQVTAPFNGLVTARHTDIGALINAGSTGSNGSDVELFRIADVSQLRVYVQLPQNYAQEVQSAMTATLYFTEHPDKAYSATLLKSADAIDPINRTLLLEFVTDNHTEELLAGDYAEVHLTLSLHHPGIRLPVNTLIFRSDGLQIATVDARHQVLLKPITLGRDFGDTVEVVGGLSVGDTVIINPPDSLVTGQLVNLSSETTQEKTP